jgi:hypothetical protein
MKTLEIKIITLIVILQSFMTFPDARAQTGMNDISFSIENVRVTLAVPRRLEFDIYVKGNNNATYLNNCVLRMFYDDMVLGTWIAQTNKIYSATVGAEFTGYALSVYDAHPGKATLLGIALTKSPGGVRTQITTNWKQLVHLSILVTTCKPAVDLNLAQSFREDIDLNVDKYITYTSTNNAPAETSMFYDYISMNDVFSPTNTLFLCRNFADGYNNSGHPMYSQNIVTCSDGGSTIIKAGAIVVMQGKESVKLSPGFHAESGSIFAAKVGALREGTLDCYGPISSAAPQEALEGITKLAEIYPNPATTGEVFFTENFKQGDESAVAYFLDSNGTTVAQFKVTPGSGYSAKVGHMKSGLYLVQLVFNKRTTTFRLMINN